MQIARAATSGGDLHPLYSTETIPFAKRENLSCGPALLLGDRPPANSIQPRVGAMGTVEDIDQMIAGINEEIARLINMTPPKDAGFLINANGTLRGLRDDWEHGCSPVHGDEQMAKLREIVDSKGAKMGVQFPRGGQA